MSYMKKIVKLAAFAALALAAAGCAKEFGGDFLPGRRVYREYKASFAGASTRTVLGEGNSVLWAEGDCIGVFSASLDTAIVVEHDGPETVIGVEMYEADTWLTAVYRANTDSLSYSKDGKTFTISGVVPSVQDGRFPTAHVSVAHLEGEALDSDSLRFKNLTSLIKFTIDRSDVATAVFHANDGALISGGESGYAEISFDADGNPKAKFGEGASSSITLKLSGAGTYYISLLPQTFAKGFSLRCFDKDGRRVGVLTCDRSVEVRRSSIARIDDFDERVDAEPADLSEEESANCYIVSASGDYKFKATVKGNADGLSNEDGDVRRLQPLDGVPAEAVVLWETTGKTSAPGIGAVVNGVYYEGGYVYFTAADVDGSALIAVKDEAGTILWSWHIWVWRGFSDNFYSQQYYGGARMMDRNLGATSNSATSTQDKTCFGLHYQWGRKDPFRGASSATTNGSSWSWMPVTEETGTVEYATKHPMTFLAAGSTPRVWLDQMDGSLWGYDTDGVYRKTIYDPCPPGWRVPDSNVWSNALGQEGTMYKATTPGVDGFDFQGQLGDAPIYYPFSGYYDGSSNVIVTNQGWYGFCWAAGCNGNAANVFGILYTKQVKPITTAAPGYGYNVRCQADFTAKPAKVAAVMLNTNSLELSLNHQGKLTAIVIPDDAANKAVTWTVAQADESVEAAVISVSEDNPAVCTVTAKAMGRCTVTVASVENPDKKASCVVDVVEDKVNDLNESGVTANSYIISRPGQYTFNASYKGNSKVRIGGTPASARVLWESYGTSEYNPYTPVIAAASLESRDGEYFVNFDTPASLKNGNAVLAVVDAAGTVLWSWHIWVCEGFEPDESTQRYKNGTYVMDRNLGATSPEPGQVESVGLFYQWGRKDPFIGPNGISSASFASSSVSWPSSVLKSATYGTIDYTVKNPMVFIATNAVEDWLVSSDSNLWGAGGGKTMYDPCPEGWRVPEGDTEGLWAESAGDFNLSSLTPDAVHSGLDFSGVFADASEGRVWYPVSGYRNWTSGVMAGQGQYAHYLSATQYSNATRARSLFINYNPGNLALIVQSTSSSSKSIGGNIRCVKE